MAVSGEQVISSSRVRELLLRGEVAEAKRCMTAPYAISGQVVRGAQRGRDLGFPTANLAEITTLVPGPGVYAATVELAGRVYRAAIHIGPNPTYGENQVKVETHIIGFQGDLYGAILSVEFHLRIRDVKRFSNVEDLRSQLQRDVAQAAAEVAP